MMSIGLESDRPYLAHVFSAHLIAPTCLRSLRSARARDWTTRNLHSEKASLRWPSRSRWDIATASTLRGCIGGMHII